MLLDMGMDSSCCCPCRCWSMRRSFQDQHCTIFLIVQRDQCRSLGTQPSDRQPHSASLNLPNRTQHACNFDRRLCVALDWLSLVQGKDFWHRTVVFDSRENEDERLHQCKLCQQQLRVVPINDIDASWHLRRCFRFRRNHKPLARICPSRWWSHLQY